MATLRNIGQEVLEPNEKIYINNRFIFGQDTNYLVNFVQFSIQGSPGIKFGLNEDEKPQGNYSLTLGYSGLYRLNPGEMSVVVDSIGVNNTGKTKVIIDFIYEIEEDYQ